MCMAFFSLMIKDKKKCLIMETIFSDASSQKGEILVNALMSENELVLLNNGCQTVK